MPDPSCSPVQAAPEPHSHPPNPSDCVLLHGQHCGPAGHPSSEHLKPPPPCSPSPHPPPAAQLKALSSADAIIFIHGAPCSKVKSTDCGFPASLDQALADLLTSELPLRPSLSRHSAQRPHPLPCPSHDMPPSHATLGEPCFSACATTILSPPAWDSPFPLLPSFAWPLPSCSPFRSHLAVTSSRKAAVGPSFHLPEPPCFSHHNPSPAGFSPACCLWPPSNSGTMYAGHWSTPCWAHHGSQDGADLWYILFFFFNMNVLCLFIYLFLAALGLPCCARASHCSGFSCCGARALGVQASVAVARGLSSCGLRALEHRLSSCGARA